MKNTLTDLHNHLFETLEALKDSDKPMPIDRAKAIVEVAQVLVNAAKVEVAFYDAVGGETATGFFGLHQEKPKLRIAGR
jgi:hypothetical protein